LKSLDLEKIARAVVVVQNHILASSAYYSLARAVIDYLIRALLAPRGSGVVYVLLVGPESKRVTVMGRYAGQNESPDADPVDFFEFSNDKVAVLRIEELYEKGGEPPLMYWNWNASNGEKFYMRAVMIKAETGLGVAVNADRVALVKSLLSIMVETLPPNMGGDPSAVLSGY
jgi:hypothetical protein